ncbi:MAG TPA: 6-hydroxymethylpterin diphosphokinase MptE-like protein [Phycisphaerae bacterium]|nr:6-hydroxymethylpterin diphosphokinase MptE-like protein [Phycisphaerae bacterium]
MTATSHSQPDVGNELFIRNMAALWRIDPELAVRIDEVPDDKRLPVEATRSGDWTTSVATPDGRQAYLHSRYDPRAEAEKLIERVDLDKNYCFVVTGFGLGYHVKALHARLRGEAFVLVTEPSLELLSTALAHVDLADEIASRRLVILTDTNKARMHAQLTPRNAVMMLGLQFVTHPPSERLAGEQHAALRRAVTDFVAYTRTTMVTLVHNAQITCRNIAYNLPTTLSTPPIDILKDRFGGCPGIVVSAGPSLRRNIDTLRDAKGRAVVCAVQTTLKPLLTRGIVPDFVTSLDFHEMSRRFFQGIDDLHGVHLVAEPKSTWHVIDLFDGPISILDSSFAHLLVGSGLAARGGLPPGATVAHLAFYLARYMGCDPIIFVGQDLAFTGHVFYVPGVEVHSGWSGEINRFNTMETKEWERIARNREILRKIEDVNGCPVYTDELLFTYLEQFEKDFIGTDARLIDATEGGARIGGTDVMSLAEALERVCARDIPAERYAYRKQVCWNDPSRLSAARSEIATRLEEVKAVEKICDDFAAVLHELEKLTGDPPRFNRRIQRVDELRTVITRHERAYQIINAASQLAELRRFSADRKIDLDGATGTDRAVRQLKRDLEFVGGIKEGAADMVGILTETLVRFDARIAQSDKQ